MNVFTVTAVINGAPMEFPAYRDPRTLSDSAVRAAAFELLRLTVDEMGGPDKNDVESVGWAWSE